MPSQHWVTRREKLYRNLLEGARALYCLREAPENSDKLAEITGRLTPSQRKRLEEFRGSLAKTEEAIAGFTDHTGDYLQTIFGITTTKTHEVTVKHYGILLGVTEDDLATIKEVRCIERGVGLAFMYTNQAGNTVPVGVYTLGDQSTMLHEDAHLFDLSLGLIPQGVHDAQQESLEPDFSGGDVFDDLKNDLWGEAIAELASEATPGLQHTSRYGNYIQAIDRLKRYVLVNGILNKTTPETREAMITELQNRGFIQIDEVELYKLENPPPEGVLAYIDYEMRRMEAVWRLGIRDLGKVQHFRYQEFADILRNIPFDKIPQRLMTAIDTRVRESEHDYAFEGKYKWRSPKPLEKAGITDLPKLLQLTEQELREIKGVKEELVEEIKKMLERRLLSLNGDVGTPESWRPQQSDKLKHEERYRLDEETEAVLSRLHVLSDEEIRQLDPSYGTFEEVALGRDTARYFIDKMLREDDKPKGPKYDHTPENLTDADITALQHGIDKCEKVLDRDADGKVREFWQLKRRKKQSAD